MSQINTLNPETTEAALRAIVYGTASLTEESRTFEYLKPSEFELLRAKEFVDIASRTDVVRTCNRIMDEAKETHTLNHCERVAWASAVLCDRLGLGFDDTLLTTKGAFTHDVGKTDPEIQAIVNLPIRFKGKEREKIMKPVEKHVLYGAEIVETAATGDAHKDGLKEITHGHHAYARFKPYGPFPCFYARHTEIVAYADELDAVASARGYKPAMPEAKTRQILSNQLNGDPRLRIIEMCFDYQSKS